ncbi:MAG: hypothetical protein CMJ31_14795 [Phycisphaerae bacterium]|nr:hypothetical protein [Phycisphaerae bacterium]
MSITRAAAVSFVLAAAGVAQAQWNPASGQWLKTDANDLRVMTWNVGDNLYAQQPGKTADAFSDWNALVRIVASLEPDVLLLQEAADNNGADPVSTVNTVLNLFRYGGSDPFVGGTVTSYIGAFALTPGYNLPYAYVLGGASDGFNRNIILSRYPITDLNGDGVAAADDINVRGDLWAPGGGGGIRGFSWAEIDLPDGVYAGDVVVGNSHLKAFGDCPSYNDRLAASRNISYFIEYYWNGAGTGMTDPRNQVTFPSSGAVLDDNTPVVIGGDWNNNPYFYGTGSCFGSRNPVEFMIGGDTTAGNGPDRDGSDMARDFGFVPGSNGNSDANRDGTISGDETTQSGSKLDFLAWQDSIATARRSFVFNSASTSFPLPQPLASGPRPGSMSGIASDHRPVIVDLILPAQQAEGPPIISNFVLTPSTLAFTDTFTIEARVLDPDGSVVGDVEFFEDSNNNGSFDDGVDQLIASVTPANPAGQSVVSAMLTPSDFLTQAAFDALIGDEKVFFVRASDGENPPSVATASASFVNLAPEVVAFAPSEPEVGIADTIDIDATVADADGEVTMVEIYFDTDDSNGLTAGDDQLVAAAPVGGFLSTSFTPGDYLTPSAYNARLGSGNRFFVVATDDKGDTAESTTSVTFVNTLPIIELFATPNPAAPGEDVMLSATVTDPDGTVGFASAVIDDGDGVFELGQDILIASFFTPPYVATIDAEDLVLGDNVILFSASDDTFTASTESIIVTVAEEPTCPADLGLPMGVLDIADVVAFLTAFGQGDPAADLGLPMGEFDIADVVAFLTFFGQGCP